jgi:hypothetical protein
MNYEFYFLKDATRDEPEILRVIAGSYDIALEIVARRYGWTAAFESRKRVTEYVESIDIHPIEIQNMFETALPLTTMPLRAATYPPVFVDPASALPSLPSVS